MKLREDVTKKSQLRAAMNSIMELLKDKSLPKKITDALEAVDAHFKQTWEGMQSGGPDDNPENEPQSNTEAMRESMTIGSRLEGEIHTQFIDMVDDLYEAGAITRDEMNQLHTTVGDVMDAFYSAIMTACPQLYDRSPWMDAPDPEDDMVMGEAVTQAADGKQFPASDFAYVPDPKKSSTWKLRLTKDPGGEPDSGIVGAAVAALGKGFRGQKVQIPSGDLADVKSKVRAAWKKANPDKSDADMPDAIKESMQESMQLLESDWLSLLERSTRPDGTAMIKIIQPGWGSSGYYPPEVLQRDGPRIFKAGTQMFWNHQTPEEEASRPEGDLNNLAGKLVEDARWLPDHPKGPGLYANSQIYDAFQGPVNDLGPDIGVSIRALGKAQPGQADGRQGAIIQEIAAAKSVDFVTKPGAGGAVLQLFESAARRGAAQTTTQKGEENMGELEALKESNAQLTRTLEVLQEKMILREAGEYAAGKLANADLPVVTKTRLQRELVKTAPVKEGKLDVASFDTMIAEAIKVETAYLVEVTGGGRIAGMGSSSDQEPKLEDAVKTMTEAFQAMGYSAEQAAKMAKGR